MTLTLTHDADLDTVTYDTPSIPNRIKHIDLKKANDVTKVVNDLSYVARARLLDVMVYNPDCIRTYEHTMLLEALQSRDYVRVRNAILRINQIIRKHNDFVVKLLEIEARRLRQAKIDAELELNRTRVGALQPGDPRRPAWLDKK